MGKYDHLTDEQIDEELKAARGGESGGAVQRPALSDEELDAQITRLRAQQPAPEPITEEGTQKGIDAANEAYDRAKYGDPGIFDAYASGSARSIPFVQRGIAAIGAGVDKLQDPDKDYGDLYDKRREDIQGRDAYIDENHPVASFLGRVGGTIGTAVVPGGMIAHGGKIGKATAPLVKALTPTTVRGAGVSGALQAAGETRHDWTKDPEEAGLETAIGGTVGAAGQKYLPGAAKWLANTPPAKLAGKFVAPVAKVAGHVLGGVSPKNISDYWNGAERIRGAKTLNQINSEVYAVIKQLDTDVELQKMSYKSAGDALGKLQDSLENNYGVERGEAEKIVDNALDALKTKKAELKGAAEKAGGYAKESSDSVRAMKEEIGISLDDKKRALNQTLQEKSAAMQSARQAKLAEIKGVRPSRETADDLIKAFEEFDKSLSTRSTEGFMALDDAQVEIPNKHMKGFLTQQLHNLENHGQPPIGEEGQGYRVIKEFRKYLDKMPKKMSGPDWKQFLRMLGAEAYKTPHGGLIRPGLPERMLRDVYRSSNEALGEKVPAYRTLMEALKPDVDLASALRKMGVNDEDKLYGLLHKINDPIKGEAIRNNLDNFGKRVGRDFVGELDEFTKAQGILKDPKALEGIYSKLPEQKPYDEAYKAAQEMQGRRAAKDYTDNYTSPGNDTMRRRRSQMVGDYLEARRAKKVAASPELLLEYWAHKGEQARFEKEFTPQNKKLVLSERLKASSESAALEDENNFLKLAINARKGASGWTEATTHSKLREIMSRKNPNPTVVNQLKYLDGINETDFYQDIKDRAVLDAFEQGFTHGSRNVNLWSLMGSILGSGRPMNQEHQAAVKLLGGFVGSAIDKIGPKMVQNTMDGLLALKNIGQFPALQAAAIKGPKDFFMAIMLLEKKDPNFKRLVESINDHLNSEEHIR